MKYLVDRNDVDFFQVVDVLQELNESRIDERVGCKPSSCSLGDDEWSPIVQIMALKILFQIIERFFLICRSNLKQNNYHFKSKSLSKYLLHSIWVQTSPN